MAGISVVIPTRGHPPMVDRVLSSLRHAAQQLPSGVGSELIVIDDSVPGDVEAIRKSCHRHLAKYVPGPRRVGAKRNLGVTHAAYPLVLFIDSDCVATPDLLKLHMKAHLADQAPSGRAVAAVAGPTIVDQPGTAQAWRIVAPSIVVNSAWTWPLRFAEVWWAATSNLSVKRELFDAVGGFDPRTYTVVGGEDVDLGIRLQEKGFTTLCSPDAVVFHEKDGITSLWQFHRKLFLYGRACVYNCTRRPDCSQWAANPVSLLAAVWLAGLLLPRRRELYLIASGAFVAWFGAESYRSARLNSVELRDAFGCTSVDWSFHAGIAAESVRRGSPMLALKRFDYFPRDKFIRYVNQNRS
jgi:GT2 family glycosyltransferase